MKQNREREKETTTNKLYWFGVVVNIKIILQSLNNELKYISIIGPITLSIISDQNFICGYFIAITLHGWRSAKLEEKKRLSDFFWVLISLFAAFVLVIIDNADYERMNIKQCLKNVQLFFLCATATITAQANSNDLKCKIVCIRWLTIKIFDLFYLPTIFKAFFFLLLVPKVCETAENFHDLP